MYAVKAGSGAPATEITVGPVDVARPEPHAAAATRAATAPAHLQKFELIER